MKEEGRLIQRNPDRLGNFMKSSKGKKNLLHVAWNNPMRQYRL